MTQTAVDIERKRRVEIAREYRKLGYEVILEPNRSQLPEFLASFQPDMLARNNIETVVVEVKSRDTLSQSAHMEALAAVIQRHEGWRFELVVTNHREKGTRIRIKDIDDLLTTQDIVYRLNEARTLSDKEYGEAAFLLAWSATEATLRRAASQHRISAEDSSISILKNLFAQGLINEDQYKKLSRSISVRNSLAHGLRETKTSASELKTLLVTTEQLLSGQ
ncbi:hypothetical protein [Candidatus Chloroploca sp. Khr17]|uniref:hypothetical protein n=1 Tax=Candidatus Chloroploca sp. Khr17 TaxID=2496869 RepID=UPI00101E1DA1|nr:hypothetical protein [Candidatus Chloroploca sp. Khr17]